MFENKMGAGIQKVKGGMGNTQNMRQQTCHKTKKDFIPTQNWYKFYSTLLAADRIEFMKEEEWKMERTNLTVSDTDVDIIIKNMKNGKSPGPGNIYLELLKYGGGKKVSKLVTKLVNKILQRDNIPQEIKTGYLIEIHNKGDKRMCENYRSINITNPFIKILGNLIKNWIEKRYKGNEEQSGFTKGRPTVDHIYVIRQITEKYNMKQENIS
jgi:hypothetical protein